jgi:hypothetical protein
MRLFIHLSFGFAMLILSACSSFDVNTDYDPSTDFASFKSYYLKPDVKIPGDVLQNMEFDRKRIFDAIERELQSKGLEQANESSADLIVVSYAGVKEKVNLNTYGYSAGPYWGPYYGGSYSTQTVVTHYNEGTLHIDIMDAKAKSLIWKGQGTAVMEQTRSPQERQQIIDEAVQEILYYFPPRR